MDTAELRGLSPSTLRLLQSAATLEPDFHLLDLVRLMRRPATALIPAIQEALVRGLLVRAGDELRFGSPEVRAALRAAAPATPHEDRAGGWDLLSEQERRIAGLVGRALTNRQVANRIGRSPYTVNYHLRRIFRKLGIVSRVELASLAHRHEQPDGPVTAGPR
ncbi:LuxR C-terminal-related transcriptional regulator [Dactylosporangium cerinum]|uniref:LuxR C-terminal-related transcriptional regulator n=1 Tax=Dactylosporangium cerinum TaxID=1434730 RepID=A0ABV9WJB7_9ACTN